MSFIHCDVTSNGSLEGLVHNLKKELDGKAADITSAVFILDRDLKRVLNMIKDIQNSLKQMRALHNTYSLALLPDPQNKSLHVFHQTIDQANAEIGRILATYACMDTFKDCLRRNIEHSFSLESANPDFIDAADTSETEPDPALTSPIDAIPYSEAINLATSSQPTVVILTPTPVAISCATPSAPVTEASPPVVNCTAPSPVNTVRKHIVQNGARCDVDSDKFFESGLESEVSDDDDSDSDYSQSSDSGDSDTDIDLENREKERVPIVPARVFDRRAYDNRIDFKLFAAVKIRASAHDEKLHPPTVTRSDGTKEWRLNNNKNGRLHRDDDLPAVVKPDGSIEFYQNGVCHRNDIMPAAVHFGDMECDGRPVALWYKNNKLHRDNDLPAVVHDQGPCEFYTNGRKTGRQPYPTLCKK